MKSPALPPPLTALLILLGAALSLVGCSSTAPAVADSGPVRAPDPRRVQVRVSLRHRAAYVMEGDRPLLVTAVAIGKAGSETPTGRFTVIRKEARKRSNTYGFHVRGSDIRSGRRAGTPPGYRYVGYPMPWWVEFHPGYGFHAGSVWPTPRTHGCLRLHPDVAPGFFALVPSGAPVVIARSLPEDATLGEALVRPTDFADPDPPASHLVSEAAFGDLMGKRLSR